MIRYVLDENTEANVFVIINNKKIKEKLCSHYPQVNFVNVGMETMGAAETLSMGLKKILMDKKLEGPVMVLDCDTYYTSNPFNWVEEPHMGAIFYTENTEKDPIYSYLTKDEGDVVTSTVEKKKISDYANTGAYYFPDIVILQQTCQKCVEQKIMVMGECYTSSVINIMLQKGTAFNAIELPKEYVISLGTPAAVEKYETKTFAFLVDLDGTLVLTDKVYYGVWDKILSEKNIELTPELYNNLIQGNSDYHVLRNFGVDIPEIGSLKDGLFLSNLKHVTEIMWAANFLAKVRRKGHKIAIVTNSNRKVATQLVDIFEFECDFLVSSDDCEKSKPDSEPYEKALSHFGIPSSRSVIFEDSKAGIISAKKVNPRILYGLDTHYKKEDLLELGVDEVLKDFMYLSVDSCISVGSGHLKKITQDLNMVMGEEVEVDELKLKGGFICDIWSFKTTKGKYIYKQNMYNVSVVSTMSERLHLCEREYLFYENVYPVIDIPKPAYFGGIEGSEGINGILLEDLRERKGQFNIQLGESNMNLVHRVIRTMVDLHNQFWTKSPPASSVVKRNDDKIFEPFIGNFIKEKIDIFLMKWSHLVGARDKLLLKASNRIADIQHELSSEPLTFIHGDVKSPNIFYEDEGNESSKIYLLDWQHCVYGKGTQDLVFFLVESFDVDFIKTQGVNLILYYYSQLILSDNIKECEYSKEAFFDDVFNSLLYTPFFVAVWFGTTPDEELLDPSFPQQFIERFMSMLDAFS